MTNTEVKVFLSEFIPNFLTSKIIFSYHEGILILAVSLIYLDGKSQPLF